MVGVAVLLVLCLGEAAPAWAQSARDGATISLQQAVAEAVNRGPALRAGLDGVELAAINQRRASSEFAPRLMPNFSSTSDPMGYARHTGGLALSTRLPTGGEVSISGDWTRYGTGTSLWRDAGYAFTVTQPLLRGFGATATADLTNAGRAVSGAERDLRLNADRLVVSVASAYLDIVRQQRSIETSRRARDRAIRLRTMSDARAKIGLATTLDVLRADVMTAQAEAALGIAEESLEGARDRLNGLLGRALGEPVTPRDDALAEAEALHAYAWATNAGGPPAPALEELVGLALATRLDMTEARDRIDDARRAVKVAQWNLLPPIALNVSYTRRDLGGPLSDAPASLWNGWRVGLSSSYSMDRAAESAAAAQAQLALDAAKQRADDAARQIAAEVRAAYRAWVRARGHVAIQRQAAEVAARQLRLAELRFERGLDGNLDVIDADNNVLQAETALVSAEIDRVLALISLRAATGTLDASRLAERR